MQSLSSQAGDALMRLSGLGPTADSRRANSQAKVMLDGLGDQAAAREAGVSEGRNRCLDISDGTLFVHAFQWARGLLRMAPFAFAECISITHKSPLNRHLLIY